MFISSVSLEPPCELLEELALDELIAELMLEELLELKLLELELLLELIIWLLELLGCKLETLELLITRAFKLIIKTENGYKLTSRGTYLYHLIEQHYTHQYIDKTWRTCGETAWPKDIKLY